MIDDQADDGERFNFRFALHMKLTRGGAIHVRRDDDHGITLTEQRTTSSDAWTRTFTCDDVPDREFATLAECIDALREAIAKQSAAEIPDNETGAATC